MNKNIINVSKNVSFFLARATLDTTHFVPRYNSSYVRLLLRKICLLLGGSGVVYGISAVKRVRLHKLNPELYGAAARNTEVSHVCVYITNVCVCVVVVCVCEEVKLYVIVMFR
jgi:hypothetical protein